MRAHGLAEHIRVETGDFTEEGGYPRRRPGVQLPVEGPVSRSTPAQPEIQPPDRTGSRSCSGLTTCRCEPDL